MSEQLLPMYYAINETTHHLKMDNGDTLRNTFLDKSL